MQQLKLAVQEHMVPGYTLIEKFELASSLGYDAIELRGKGNFMFQARLDELQHARAAGVVMPTECVEMDHFIGDFDPGRSRDAIENMKSQITTIVQAGGYGAITPAAWGMFSRRLPPFEPPRSPDEDRDLLLDALRELGEHAAFEGGKLLLEPLNRYEDHMVNTLAQAVDLLQTIGLDSLGVVVDTYHVNIEEDDMAHNIQAASEWIRHVQLGDSSRYQPGTGHLDWRTILEALHSNNYTGYMALECRLRGDPTEALRSAAEFMRGQWAQFTIR